MHSCLLCSEAHDLMIRLTKMDSLTKTSTTLNIKRILLCIITLPKLILCLCDWIRALIHLSRLHKKDEPYVVIFLIVSYLLIIQF